MKKTQFVLTLIIISTVLFFSCTSQFYFDLVSERKPTSSCIEPQDPNSLKARSSRAWSHDWLLNQDYENVSITSNDELALNATFIRSTTSTHAVILAHGYSGCGFNMSEIAKTYYEDYGYSVLMPDARAHGNSEGEYIGFGWLDRLDYLQWIDWLISTLGSDTTIVLHGISMGASTVLMTAGENIPTNVKAVISDSAFTSVYDEVLYVLRTVYKLNDKRVKKISALSKEQAGYSFEEASTLAQVKKIKIPVLFIHGEDDFFVPLWMLYALYDACPSSKQLHTFPLTQHASSNRVDPQTYKKIIEQFLIGL